MVSIDTVFAVLLIAFVASQVAYFLVNIGVVRLWFEPRREVTEAELSPEEYRHLEVLLPVYGEQREVIEGTLASVADSTYPNELIRVHLIHDETDEVVGAYAADLVAAARETHGFDVERVIVRDEHPVWERLKGLWRTARLPLARNKARALTYALYTRPDGTVVEGATDDGWSPAEALAARRFDGVVTVLDADTEVPPDLFELGVAGLTEYDIVQAKQTVRNRHDGFLPAMEAMGIAAWSHLVYARTTRYPYQLLGKGYFVEPETLYEVFGWDPSETTEDMAFGIAAYSKGYTLGIVDRYVGDLCPAGWGDWVRQKTRWVTGPYRAIRAPGLTTRDRIKFASYTLLNQAVSVVNLVGVPGGAYALYLTVVGGGLPLAWPVRVLVGFNLLMWAGYTALSYRATADALAFESRLARLGYYLWSNPLTQVLYATLWAVPILLGLAATLLGRQPTFEVTPKRVDPQAGRADPDLDAAER